MSNLLQTVIPAAATFLVGYQGALTRTSRLRKSIRADMDMLDALPDGHPLHGENTYRLQVPADVPVQQFWSVTVYNKQTAALFRESTHVALGSLQPGLQRNEDGTTDIYFGPEAPAGHESRAPS